MSKENTHVIASVNGGWSVRRSRSERAQRTFGTKDEAVKYGRKMARERNSDLVIHGRDGLVSERNSYGNDPFPSRSESSSARRKK